MIVSRRRLLVAAGGLLLTNGCKRTAAAPSSCTDVASLTDEERAARTALAYEDRGPDPTKSCAGCQQWVNPTVDGSCGGCKLLKGPIHPQGTCKAFAFKG